MMYPLVLDLAADSIPVTVTCRVLGFSKQAFYAWCKSPITQRDWDDAHLINAAIDIHHDDPEFGYRFIADELAGKGIPASRNRVNRLCSLQRLWSAHSRKKGLNRRPGPPVHDDLVLREFTAPKPNMLWLTDITEHPTAWIPAVVATPGGGVGHGGSAVLEGAEGDVLPADRSWRDGAGGGGSCRCSRRRGLQMVAAGRSVDESGDAA